MIGGEMLFFCLRCCDGSRLGKSVYDVLTAAE